MKTRVIPCYPTSGHRIEITDYFKEGGEKPYQVEVTHYDHDLEMESGLFPNKTQANDYITTIWGKVHNA